jgi:hypothetical protein
MIPVVLPENVEFQQSGHGKGRRYSGVHELPDGLARGAERAIKAAAAKGLTMWEATTSPFAYSKLVKEIVRNQLVCYDIDLDGAAPRAVLARHPDNAFVEDYVERREQHYQAASTDRAASKSLYHSALYGSTSGGAADVAFISATERLVPDHLEVPECFFS